MSDSKNTYFYAVGKRKTSIAQVRLYKDGKGECTINDRDLKEYFHGLYIGNVMNPLKLTGQSKNFNITVKVSGGGYSSQSDAVKHGISLALLEFDPALRSQLKKEGLITRDARIKERKKPGLRRARRSPQWAKR